MPVPTSQACATCTKPCYPTEKVMVSDLWVHKDGCLKCSVCFTTLSLSSVYVASAPIPPGEKQLYCSKDVPKVVHANIVDSLALRAAMNAPKVASTPVGMFGKGKTSGGGKSIRFKGLTLRSRAIKAGLEAPKLDLKGLMRSKTVVGQVPGSPLDSWDLIHAMNVQSNVSSPIRDHPAIHAQRTGSSAYGWPMPSQPLPLSADVTGTSDHARAGKDEDTLIVEPDLVKNLIKVFQLDSVSSVKVDLPDEEDEDMPLDDVFSTAVTSSKTFGTLTKHGMREVGTLKTLATLGSRRFGTGVSTTSTLHAPSHQATRLALSEIFNPNPIPVPPPPTPAKVSREDTVSLEEGRKAMALLHALLPMAAHLIPLPMGDSEDEELDEVNLINLNEVTPLRGEKPAVNVVDESPKGSEEEDEMEKAREELLRSLEEGDLEIIMLFEELPQAEDYSTL